MIHTIKCFCAGAILASIFISGFACAGQYADNAKARIKTVLEGRDFVVESTSDDCKNNADCTSILDKIKSGNYDIVEPIAFSENDISKIPIVEKVDRFCSKFKIIYNYKLMINLKTILCGHFLLQVKNQKRFMVFLVRI